MSCIMLSDLGSEITYWRRLIISCLSVGCGVVARVPAAAQHKHSAVAAMKRRTNRMRER
jgi:hypothetical protein